MTAQPARQLESPRFENENAKIFAGLRGHYTGATVAEIPQLWQQLAPNLGNLPEQIDSVAYGIVEYRATGGFDYMCAMEVSGADGLPSEFVVIKVPALRFAKFTHHGHVSKIPDTVGAIFQQWMSTSVYAAPVSIDPTQHVPTLIEFYGREFDPQSGMGGMEVWVPVRD
jgi:AraC family transcriptional regulator